MALASSTFFPVRPVGRPRGLSLGIFKKFLPPASGVLYHIPLWRQEIGGFRLPIGDFRSKIEN
jgi:hypothetical protein